MDTDDLEPPRKRVKKIDMDTMSIEQLSDYIAEMEAEIGRAREAIKTKDGARSAADAVFKS